MSKIKSILAFAAVLLCGGAWATAPIVVWDRDMSDATATRKGADGKDYTITLNTGNTFEGGCLKIGNTATIGATIDIPADAGKAYTVLIKYSNLSKPTVKTAIGGVSAVPNNIKNIGVAVAANSLECKPFWNGSDYAYSADTTPSLVEGSGYAQFCYKNGNRWRTWAGSTLSDDTAKEGITCGLVFSSDIAKLAIGGPAVTGGPAAWKGLVIESIALFKTDGQIAHSDTKGTIFPSNLTNRYTATVSEGTTAIADLNWTDKTGATVAYSSITANDYLVLSGSGKVTTPASFGLKVEIGEGVELMPAGVAATAVFFGKGQVTYPLQTLPGNEKACYQSGQWSGTVFLRDCGNDRKSGHGYVPLQDYGNTCSTIKLSGFKGYTDVNKDFPGTIILENGTGTDGNGVATDHVGADFNNGNGNTYFKAGALKGDGTLEQTANGGTCTMNYMFTDVSEFAGSVNMSGTRPMNFVFGTRDKDASNYQKKLYIADDAKAKIADGKIWSAVGGIIVNGSLGGTGTIGSDVTFGDTASIDLTGNAEGAALTLADGKTLTLGSTLNLVGANNGNIILKGVATEPANLNMIALKVNGSSTDGRLAYNSQSKAIVFTTGELVAWTPNLDNTAAISNGILDWTAVNAWKDTNQQPATWTWKDATAEGAPNVKLDAKDIQGVKITGKINAGEVHLVNTAAGNMPFDFHNRTLDVEGDTTYNAEKDCLATSAVIMTTYNGKLGLKVPITGAIALGDDVNLTFKTGNAGGDASTAYDYSFGRAMTIAVEGDGAFEVPNSMYGVEFTPQATATLVYNVASGLDKTVNMPKGITHGTVLKKGLGTLTLTSNFSTSTGLTVEEGTLKYNADNQGFNGTLTVKKGATFVNLRGSDVLRWSESNVTVNLYGMLALNETRFTISDSQTWNVYAGSEISGTHQSGDVPAKSFDVGAGNNSGPIVNFIADPTEASSIVNWNADIRMRDGKNLTFNVAKDVTVVVNSEIVGNNLTLTKSGQGTLKIKDGVSADVNVVVSNGALDLSEITDGAAVLKKNLTIGENGTVILPSGEFTVCAGTLSGLSSAVKADGQGGLNYVTVNGNTVTTESATIPEDLFGKASSNWQNVYTGPMSGEDADGADIEQWGIHPNNAVKAPQLADCNNWSPMLFDGNLIKNVSVGADGYKTVGVSSVGDYAWVGWALKVGVANSAKVVVDRMNMLQSSPSDGDMFIGVDSTSKLVISHYDSKHCQAKTVVDIAAKEGLTIGDNFNQDDTGGELEYYFRGTGDMAGSIKVGGTFNIGSSHKVKYVEISADEIGKDTTKTQYKVRKYRKLIGFTSSTLNSAKVSFASDATVKVGDAEPSAALVRGDGEELNALDPDGTAKIVSNPAGMDPGIYVQYIGYSETRPSQYQWVFDPTGDDTDTTDNWSGEKNWKGIVSNGRRTTWNDDQVWTNDTTKDPHWTPETDSTYNDYINYANDITFYFDAAVQQTVSVDYTVAATLADAWVAGSGVKTDTATYKDSTRLIKVVNTANTPGIFKFNLPQGANVNDEGAPLEGFDWSKAAEVSAPIDATGFNGELGLRAKLTGPITLGKNAKVVFVKPGSDETIAYDYDIRGNGVVEARGSGKFVVPSNMYGIAFEVTAGNDASAGSLVYEVAEGETVTVTAPISGNGGVIKRGAGTLVLPPSCSFKGALQVLQGEVKMNAPTDALRLDSIVVSSGATFTFIVSDELIESGYNASNVTGDGTFRFVDSNDVELKDTLSSGKILRGTKKVWRQGAINSNYITSDPMAVLYNLKVEDLTSGDYTLVAKLGGSSVNRGTPMDATVVFAEVADAEGWLHIQIQVVDDNYLKVHEIAINDGKDETQEFDAIWAKSIQTGYVRGGSAGTFVTQFTGTGEAYKTVYLRADAHTNAAQIGDTQYPSVAKAIAEAALNGSTVTLMAPCSLAINIPAGVTVKTSTQNAFTGTASGAGTLEIYAAPANKIVADTWTGTVLAKGFNWGDIDLTKIGTANSTVQLSKITGHTPNSNNGTKGYDGTVEFVDADNQPGLKITADYNSTFYFNKVIGSGTFQTVDAHNSKARFAMKDVSGFEGTLNLAGNKGVVIGDVTDGNSYGTQTAKLVINANKTATIANGKTWKAEAGITVNGTIKGSGALGSDTTFANGATINLDAGALTVATGKTVTFGSTLNVTATSLTSGMTVLTVASISGDLPTVNGDFYLVHADGALKLVAKPVAVIGTKEYSSLTAAIAAVVSGETIVLMKNDATNVALGENVTFDVTGATYSGEVSGSGTIVYSGFDSVQTNTKNSLILPSWTGTLQIKGSNDIKSGALSGTASSLNSYGTVNSKIEFKDCAGTSGSNNYFGTTTDEIVPEIVITGTLKLTNGFTYDSAHTGSYTIFRKLSGTGSFVDGNTASQMFYAKDVSEFSGSISVSAKKFVVGDHADSDYEIANGSIIVRSGYAAPIVGTWTGTSMMVEGEIYGTGTVNAPLTFASTATIEPQYGVVTAGSTVTVENSATIKLLAAPGESGIKIVNYTASMMKPIPVEVVVKVGVHEETLSGYGLAQKTDGLYVVPQSTLVWQGASGSTITADGVWTNGSFADNAEYGIFSMPAQDSTVVINVPASTPDVSYIKIAEGGNYKFVGEGQDWKIGVFNAAGATVVFENIKVDIEATDITSEEAMKALVGTGAHVAIPHEAITLGSGETLTLKAGLTYKLPIVPTLNNEATIQIENAANVVWGTNYKLLSWTTNKAQFTYGKPALAGSFTTPANAGAARLMALPKCVYLQLRSAEQMARKPLTIWPFGDSITEGMNVPNSRANYRIPLCQKLSLAGYNVKTVGFSDRNGKNNFGAIDASGNLISDEEWNFHSGVGGELAVRYTSNHGTLWDSWENALDQAGNPDIVLMHIGINDLNNANNTDCASHVEPTFAAIKTMATRILQERPGIKVVISSMNRLQKGQTFQKADAEDDGLCDGNKYYVKAVHDKLVDLYAQIQRGEIPELPADRVFFADMYANIRPRSYSQLRPEEDGQPGLFIGGGDNIHPDWAGHDIMSDTWLEQIKLAYPLSDGSTYHANNKVDVEYKHGAINNVPDAYMTGFKKARVLTPAADGTERVNTLSVVNPHEIADETVVEKIGYFVEYEFPSSTTNVHRWVWVDMDAFGTAKTVAEAGLPSADANVNVKTVSKLHITTNHPAVDSVAADDDTVSGFVEFSPYNSNGGKNTTPTHWMGSSWNDNFGTTPDGSMQIHRIAPPGNPYQADVRPAQVVFAYNGWNSAAATPTEFGIGDFSQHYDGASQDWTNMRNTKTMHSGKRTAKSIEIWVKPVEAEDQIDVDPAQSTEVEATDAEDAISKVTLVVSDAKADELGQAALLKLEAKETSEGSGQWIVSAVVDKDATVPNTSKTVQTAVEETAVEFAQQGLESIAGATETTHVDIPAAKVIPGLYYSVSYGTTPDNHTEESARVLATGSDVTIPVQALGNEKVYFIKIKASATK